MKPLYLVACLLVSTTLSAQMIYEEFYFYGAVEDTCGSGNSILRPEHFIAYQTIDNTQDGEIDPTTCVDWISGGLNLEGADLTRPVFVRLVDVELELPSSDIFMFALSDPWDWDSEIGIDFGNQEYCFDGLCNGMQIEIQIPDEFGEGTTSRKWQQEFALLAIDTQDLYQNYGMHLISGFAMCVPTESFEQQQLLDLVMKFKFTEEMSSVSFDTFTIFTNPNTYSVTNENVSNFELGDGYWFGDLGGETSNDYVFRFDAEGYPSEVNRSYVDFYPNSNLGGQQTIEILFEELTTFTMEPFTYFRGGLVEGEDSLRHNLSIINLGASICFNSHYDVIIQKGWSYIHQNGMFDFQGGSACMQLNGGSNMLISENGLRYGQVGQGMFALYGGSNILLEPKAHLHFDGKMLLAQHQWDTEPILVVMTLKEGAKLSFSEFAKLEDLSAGQTKLLFYNQGGSIDLTHLTDEERSYIQIVNEEVEAKHITILGNPVAVDSKLAFLLFEEGEALVRILDTNGKLMLESEVGQTSSLINLSMKGLPAGAYLLQVKQQSEVRTERFVIN